MPKQTRRKHRLASIYGTKKKPIVLLSASDAFQVTDKETKQPVNHIIYRLCTERHRDGRTRQVLRGRDLTELIKFEIWKQKNGRRASKENRAA